MKRPSRAILRAQRLRGTVGVLLVFLVFTPTLGCGSSSAGEEAAAVRGAVSAYNQALTAGFATLDMNALSQTATQGQAQREYYLMAALGESRVRMLATLVDIEFGEVTFSGEDQAAVTTTETWDYEHVSLETSETVRSERGVVYHLRYDLVMQDGRWLVDRVTSLDEPPTSDETTR